jgi:DNA-binding response OmpR family regulator
MAPRTADESWRLAGCGVRCKAVRVTFPGRRFTEAVPIHDPHHHEAYGEAVLLRRYSLIAGRVIRTGALTIDGFDGTFTVDGEVIRMTPNEAKILGFLATNIGALCHPAAITRAVWGPDYFEPRHGGTDASQYHVLRANVSRLRKKLGTARRLLVTDIGRGYRLIEEAAP